MEQGQRREYNTNFHILVAFNDVQLGCHNDTLIVLFHY